jgi:hypothetical protein
MLVSLRKFFQLGDDDINIRHLNKRDSISSSLASLSFLIVGSGKVSQTITENTVGTVELYISMRRFVFLLMPIIQIGLTYMNSNPFRYSSETPIESVTKCSEGLLLHSLTVRPVADISRDSWLPLLGLFPRLRFTKLPHPMAWSKAHISK